MAVRRSRPGERGAALFIVVLVVTLLTAIGVFAVHATSLAQLGSGYSRREATAFYLGEFAANERASMIADQPDSYMQQGLANTDTCRTQTALLPLLTANAPKFCVAADANIVKNAAYASNTSLASDPEGFFGALSRPDNPADEAVNADIRIESVDHGPAPAAVAGMALNGTSTQTSAIWQDTVTTTGRLLPLSAGNECTAATTRASENQQFRGFVVYTTTLAPAARSGP